MPEPYFPGQKPSATCGCFYPDITRISDDPDARTRTYWCMTHKEVVAPLGEHEQPIKEKRPIPSEAWRQAERVVVAKTGQS